MTWRPSEHGGWLVCAIDDLPADALGPDATMTQDPDVLDTWFSSALWPHSTMGWPAPTAEMAKYYPTSVLSTARDIITLWVARMVIFGQFNTGDVPFRDVFIHPVIQDGHGKRMSKTAGNGIDPVDIIDLYGADTLRFTLASLATETQDLRMPVEKSKLPDGRQVNTSERFEQGRTFPNKFWNASRFALMNLADFTPAPVDESDLATEDRWILQGLDELGGAVTTALGAFRFAEATPPPPRLHLERLLRLVRRVPQGPPPRPGNAPRRATRRSPSVLDGLCRLLHPIMPFVTEQVWQALNVLAPVRGLDGATRSAESVCIAAWPSFEGHVAAPRGEEWEVVESWRSVIQAIRNMRAEREVAAAAKVAPILVAAEPTAGRLRQGTPYIASLVGASDVTIVPHADRPADAAVSVLADVEIILPLTGLIDKEAERSRHRKALTDLDRQIGPIRAKLSNANFLERAPADVVSQQQAKLADLDAQRATIAALLGEVVSPAQASRVAIHHVVPPASRTPPRRSGSSFRVGSWTDSAPASRASR